MSPARIEISEVFESLKLIFKGIDLRVVCFKEDYQFKNVLIVLRLSYQDPTSIKRHHKNLFKRFGPIETNNLKVISESYSIDHFFNLTRQLCDQKIGIAGREILLGKSIRVFEMKEYIQDYVRNLKEMDKYAGSCIEITEGNRSPVFDNEDIQRQVGILGYRDVYSTINGILETNFSSTSAFDFLIYIPIYAKIENIAYKGKNITGRGRCHKNLGDLSLRLLVSKRDPHKGEMVEKNISGKIIFGRTSHNFRLWRATINPGDLLPEYLIELKLLHPKIGELCGYKTRLKEMMGEAERSPLFSILKQFCFEEDLKKSLLEPQKLKKSQNIFERSISWLLTLLGFSVIWLEEYEKLREPSTKVEYSSIDILAFHMERGVLALVNCTIGVPKDNELDRILEAKRIIQERYGENMKLKMVPVIFSAAKRIDTIKNRSVKMDVRVFDGNEIEAIFEEMKHGNESIFFDSLSNPLFRNLWVRSKDVSEKL